MGQKENPNALRLGYTKDWLTKWYANKKDYADYLIADMQTREFLDKKLKGASISSVQIERPTRKNVRLIIYSARPGVIIGKKGDEVEKLRREISKIMKVPVHITIQEVRKPELNARLVAENIAQQLERRVMFRRAMKRALQSTMRAGAQGVKICLSGRLAGAEIARTEWSRDGRVPLHTFRADIDYGTARALTTYGIIGVKVWIFKGEIHEVKEESPEEEAKAEK